LEDKIFIKGGPNLFLRFFFFLKGQFLILFGYLVKAFRFVFLDPLSVGESLS
jgi:hypothetical protein